MNTLQDIYDQIAVDMARSNLTDEIESAVDNAIKHYQDKRFKFKNLKNLQLTTSDSTFDYDGDEVLTSVSWNGAASVDVTLDDVWELDTIFLQRSGQRQRLTEVPFEDIEYLTDSSASSGEPYWYARRESHLLLYPIPDDAYIVRMSGNCSYPTQAASENTPWASEAGELIRCRAKAYLYLHKVHEPQEAAIQSTAEMTALNNLIGKHNRSTRPGRIRRAF